MSKNYALQAEKRDRAGKGVARALRRENKLPGVIYGDNKDPINVSLPAKEMNLTFNRGGMFTTICEMDVDGEKHIVLARDVQLHPVNDQVIHADFLRVTPKTTISVSVPIKLLGEDECPGLQEKSILAIVRYDIEITCSAMSIPDFIEVDISKAEIGDTIHISSVTLPEGTKPVLEHDFTILNITEPRKIEVEEVAEEGAEGEGAEGEAAEGEGDDAAAEGGDDKAEGGSE